MIRVVVPYTKEVLDAIIYEYQEIFWPVQWGFLLLALLVVYFFWKDAHKYSAVITSILAFFWIWVGAVYEMGYYTSINWIGSYVGALFILQGLLLGWFGIYKKEVIFVKNSFSLVLALTLILAYPLVQLLSGIHYFEVSIVGMLPDITVVFLLILLWMNTQKKGLKLF